MFHNFIVGFVDIYKSKKESNINTINIQIFFFIEKRSYIASFFNAYWNNFVDWFIISNKLILPN